MRRGDVGIGTSVRGIATPGIWGATLACLLGVTNASADPVAFIPTQTAPDLPPRSPPGPAPILQPTWDLDGTYLWLGPLGAATHIDAQWDTAFGVDATVIRIREHASLAAIGGTFGASRYTVRDGGELWLDALVGREIGGHMIGLSLRPILELSELEHPKVGASMGLWGFIGVAPYVRLGAVESLGTFAEIGVHIALPVIRR